MNWFNTSSAVWSNVLKNDLQYDFVACAVLCAAGDTARSSIATRSFGELATTTGDLQIYVMPPVTIAQADDRGCPV